VTFETGAYAKQAAREWDFGGVDYMNHGSFGACPRAVQDFVQKQRLALMQNPIEYFTYETPKRVAEGRLFWSEFTKADLEGIVLVECATLGVSTVLKSLELRGYFKEGDEILLTTHGYNACNNAVREIAQFTGVKPVIADIPFPVESPQQVTAAILAAATKRTRLALIDHVTSEAGLIFPIQDIVRGLKERGIETLVDGAHAPAQVPLDVAALGAAFYTGNGHKWLCAAPGCAFLYVREDFRERIRPLSTSHGANDPNPNMSVFQKTFAWTGTRDVTPYFTPQVAFDTLSSMHPDGLWGVVEGNRRLVRYGYQLLLDALKLKAHAPENMIGTMATVLLPPGNADELRDRLRKHNFVAQVGDLSPQFGKGRFLRISAQVYNMPEQYERLVKALEQSLKEEK
jgi:isopenicillin-N epimerase